MDSQCIFEYGLLREGSYFGDVSVLFEQPSIYSYAYNPLQDEPIQCLSISKDKFLQICRSYPICYEHLLNRAYKRKNAFTNYKLIYLISLMKRIKQNYFKFVRKKVHKMSMQERIEFFLSLETRINLYNSLIQQYELYRLGSKIKELEHFKKFKKFPSEDQEVERKAILKECLNLQIKDFEEFSMQKDL